MSPIQRRESDGGTGAGLSGAQGYEPNQPHEGRLDIPGQPQHQDMPSDRRPPRQGASNDAS
eukprot:12908575-Prorocentrum_lima.AAC.1